MIRFCIVEGCVNTSKNSNLPFFGLPQDTIRAEKWLAALKLKPLTVKYISFCGDHFELKSFANTLKTRLIYYAVPTLQRKVKEVAGPSEEESEKVHFLSQNLRASNQILPENSEVNELSNAPIIASLYIESNSKRKVENVHQSIKKMVLETTLDQYLSKRYMVTKNEEYLKSLSKNTTHAKVDFQMDAAGNDLKSSCIIVKKSCKENCGHFGQVASDESNISKQPFDSNFSSENCHPSINVNNKTLSNDVIQDSSIQEKSVSSTFKTNSQLISNEYSMKHPHTTVNQSLSRTKIDIPSKPHLVTPVAVSSFPSDDCDIFALSISAQLKKLKNPIARAKAKLNIQNILFEAETGVYDS